MTEKKQYLFGPVPSRRLGLSLGVDIVPFKACSLDCVYCQLGRTTKKTIERKEYVAIEPVLAELKKRVDKDLQADFITFSGSGEPTLHAKIGWMIQRIRSMTELPIAVITNGSLLYDPAVRQELLAADADKPRR